MKREALFLILLVVGVALFVESLWGIDWAMSRCNNESIRYFLPWAWGQYIERMEFVNMQYYKIVTGMLLAVVSAYFLGRTITLQQVKKIRGR
jgi:hypothetical protein